MIINNDDIINYI